MYNIITNHNAAYGIKEYIVNTVDDIATIPILSSTRPGSTVLVMDSSARYILNNKQEWVKVKPLDETPDADEGVVYTGRNINYESVTSPQVIYDGGELV